MADAFGFKALIEQLEGLINKKINDKFQNVLRDRMRRVFRKDAGAALKKKLLDVYDDLASAEDSEMPAFIRGKDPMMLSKVRNLFEEQLDRELGKMRFDGDTFVINIGDREAWGLEGHGNEGPLQTVDFLVYYIEGMVGEFAYITKEMYDEFRGHGLNKYGRLGAGFLIPKDIYFKERWNNLADFEDVRHPVSGQPPFNGFNEVVAQFDFSPYLNKAIDPILKRILNDTYAL